ncbi:MAG: competence protein ComK [Acholeplasma sp.]|nr:competence protein ComK [Acholeplasma sp.]
MQNKTIKSIRTIKSFSFFQNIEYLANNPLGSLVCINSEKHVFKERSIYITNYICKLHLTSIKSYYEGISLVFSKEYKVPIVLSKNIILIHTHRMDDYDNIWINYAMVERISSENDKVVIQFKSGKVLMVDINIAYLLKQINKIERIVSYFEMIKCV